MPDYMKEAKRLAQAYADAVLLGEGNDEALAALLAHIQRGAVPEGWQVVPKEPTPEMQFPSYMGSDGPNWPERQAIYKAMLAAAPAPDHSGDATEMVAEPAEVPMPEPAGWIGWIRHEGGAGRHPMFSRYEPKAYPDRDQVVAMSDVRTYGDAREAAGYAWGLAKAGRDTERLDSLENECNDLRTVSTGEDDYEWVVVSLHMAPPREREVGRGRNVRDAIDSALRGEVKP